MGKLFLLMNLLLISKITLGISLTHPIPNGPSVILPAGTPVSLTLNQEVSSEEVEIGHIVEFVVRMDVTINRQIIIATNAYGEGVVVEVKKFCEHCRRKRRGCGLLVIKADSVQAVDGSRIYLNGRPMKITGNCCCGGGPAIAQPERTYRAAVLNNVNINL